MARGPRAAPALRWALLAACAASQSAAQGPPGLLGGDDDECRSPGCAVSALQRRGGAAQPTTRGGEGGFLAPAGSSAPTTRNHTSEHLLHVPPCQISSEAKISYQRDSGPVETLSWGSHGAFPLDVPEGGFLAVSVCNVGGAAFAGGGALEVAQALPSIVGAVARGSRVRVEVVNSWNAVVAGGLAIGHGALAVRPALLQQAEQRREAAKRAANATISLMPTVVSGPLGPSVRVEVVVRQSGNVLLATPGSSLRVRGGALAGTVVGAENLVLDNGYVQVEWEGSGNVASLSAGQVSVESGTLVGDMFECANVTDSSVHVSVANASNVKVATLEVLDGKLMGSLFKIGHQWRDASAHLAAQDTANFAGHYLNISDAELIDEFLDSESDIQGAVQVSAAKVANVVASAVQISDSKLVDEVISVDGNVNNATLAATLKDVANVRVADVMNVTGESSELAEEVVDSANISATYIAVDLEQVGNVFAPQLQLPGPLVDDIFDAKTARDTRIEITLRSVANFHGGALDGRLFKKVINLDQSLNGYSAHVSKSNVGQHVKGV